MPGSRSYCYSSGTGTRDSVDNLHPEQLVKKKGNNNNDVKNK